MYRRVIPLLLAMIAAAPLPAQAQSQTMPEPIDPGIATRAVHEPTEAPAPRPKTEIETPPDRSAAPLPTRILAGAIRVDGGEDLPPAEIMTAISSYIGHRLSQDDLQDLLTAVSGVARAHGYLFAHSSIPPQTLTAGVLHIALDEGQVDEIRQTGTVRSAVAEVLSPLQGHAPTRAEVERRLMLAADLPGVTIGKVRYAMEGGKGVLIVPVGFDRVSGSAALDNRGLEALGPERTRLTVNVNDLLSNNDQVTFQGLATPLQPHELVALYGRYAIQPTASGTEFAVYGSYGETHSGGPWHSYHPRGESDSIGISVAQPLLRGAKNSLWLMLQGDRIGVDEWWNGTLVRRDRVTTVSASINGYAPLAGGRLRAGGAVTQGVLALGATRRDYPLATRFDGGSDFTMVSAWANWEGDLSGPISARLATTSQLTTDPLPAVEQLTIGGPYFGRGYNWSERTGDEGVLGSAELRARLINRNHGFVRWAQLYTFADAGYVSNLKTDFGTGDLYSAGAGARLTFTQHLSLELEAAFPIDADRYDSGDKSPRLSFSLTSTF
ncbi:MAG: ShlB/FhaC/HecB family hemolysin secretion/activation protein [Sphingomonas sp.]